MAVSFTSQAVVSGLSNPTPAVRPDGQLYVAQQGCLIKIYGGSPSRSPASGPWSRRRRR